MLHILSFSLTPSFSYYHFSSLSLHCSLVSSLSNTHSLSPSPYVTISLLLYLFFSLHLFLTILFFSLHVIILTYCSVLVDLTILQKKRNSSQTTIYHIKQLWTCSVNVKNLLRQRSGNMLTCAIKNICIKA